MGKSKKVALGMNGEKQSTPIEENEEQKFEEPVLQNECEREAKEEDQSRNLQLRLDEKLSAYLDYRVAWWEELEWNNYLYKTKEIDCFQLPIVNEYLSEWLDDDSYNESIVFKKCRECFQIIDKLNFAIAVCASATEKQKKLWKEGIRNVKETILKKLDYLSFMLIKDAEKYLNPRTGNMEYVVKDSEEDDTAITLCLWANIYKAARKQGTSILGFSFKLPMDLVLEDCAVRLMHTSFDYVSPENLILLEEFEEEQEEVQVDVLETEEASEALREVEEQYSKSGEAGGTETEAEGKRTGKEGVTQTSVEKDEAHDDTDDTNAVQEEKDTSSEKEEEENIEGEMETVISNERLDENSLTFTAFDPSILPPLVEPEMQIIDPDEYFIVGGVFFFEIYLVPQLNCKKGKITYIHREMPKLRRIRYKRKIVPPRTLDGDTPYIVSAYERERFFHEVKKTIFVQLQLPEKVKYFGTPEPARLFPEKGGYSKDCIYDVEYFKGTKQISFKVNQFGIFGMLQKKYQNLPYKKWSLKGAEAAVVSLVGQFIEIDVQITNEGYSVVFLHPDDDFIFTQINSTWTTADLLIKKLRSLGINILFGKNADKFANISLKRKNLEDKVYDCMALLSGYCSFASTKLNTISNDEIILEYVIGKQRQHRNMIIRNHEAIDYEEELKRIEAAKLAREEEERRAAEEALAEETKADKELVEEPEPGDEAVEVPTENGKEAELQEIEQKPAFSDLYHYVLNEIDETHKEGIQSTNACLVENVRTLLKLCRPISSMQKPLVR